MQHQVIQDHNSLVAELKNQGDIKKRKMFFRLLKQHQYNQALRMACEQCTNGDAIQLKVVTTLLKYRRALNIDLNEKDKFGNCCLIFACKNHNIALTDLLLQHEADPRIGSTENSEHPTTMAYILSHVTNALAAVLYKDEFNQLITLFNDPTKLPPKHAHPDDNINAKFDALRLSIIVKAIDYIIKLERLRADPKTMEGRFDIEKKEFNRLAIANCRDLLAHICKTIFNLSYSLRERYGKSFELAPFTWVTFEQLGGSMTYGIRTPISVTIPMGLSSQIFPEHCEIRENFRNEILKTTDIVEGAIPDIIAMDLPILREFFKKVLEQQIANDHRELPLIKLSVIKALTAYVRDRHTLVCLLNIVNYTDNENISVKNFSALSFTLLPPTPFPFHQRRFGLTSLMGKHAGLRRLEKLGELVTGKNFSVPDLDDTIDWLALITIRDTITHQDEADNKLKVDLLLQQQKRLEKIFNIEFIEIDARLTKTLDNRAKKLGCDTDSALQCWQNILKVSQEKYAPKPVVAPQIAQVTPRTNIENQALFIQAMVDNKAPEELVKLAKGVLSGIENIPPKKIIGEILRYIPKENKNIREIFSLAIEPPAKSKDQRKGEKAARDQKIQAVKANREQERENQFSGISELRSLAKEFKATIDPQFRLNPLKRIEIAIANINNIEMFLIMTGYLNNETKKQSLLECDAFNTKLKRPTLYKILCDNHELRDAIEYNLGQALQFITQLNVANDSVILQQSLENLRAFRNYLEHGCMLEDKSGYDQIADVIPDNERIKKMPAIIFKLVREILPELERIKVSMLEPRRLLAP